MAHDSPCMWGSRIAVPLGWGGATVDDVRTLVDAVHQRIDVQFPRDDFFLNVLGIGRLAGRLPKHVAHLGGRHGRVVILGGSKIRQPHMDALEDIRVNGESDLLKALAKLTGEIGQQAVRDCVDALAPEVRGGTWCWRGGHADNYEALMQEHRAWAHLGATPRDLSHDLADTLKSITDLEEKHDGADPASWRWGDGTPCADVFAADEAKRKHVDLKAKAAALQQLCSGASSGGATRDRSRSRGLQRAAESAASGCLAGPADRVPASETASV